MSTNIQPSKFDSCLEPDEFVQYKERSKLVYAKVPLDKYQSFIFRHSLCCVCFLGFFGKINYYNKFLGSFFYIPFNMHCQWCIVRCYFLCGASCQDQINWHFKKSCEQMQVPQFFTKRIGMLSNLGSRMFYALDTFFGARSVIAQVYYLYNVPKVCFFP